MSSYEDEFRNKCVEFLEREIEYPYSRNIEKSIYNYAIETAERNDISCSWDVIIFKQLYISKMRSIYTNLKKSSYIKNIDFKEKILCGEIEHGNIAKLTAYDIYPENWKLLFDMKAEKDKKKSELKPEAMTDSYKCRKCGSRKCSYYELQTRSADEPMTQFINCLECNNRWKQ
jgi:transcription elongation factor S-II